MVLKVVDEGKIRDIAIEEGAMYLLPGKWPRPRPLGLGISIRRQAHRNQDSTEELTQPSQYTPFT